jgi:hypothetical protein
MQKGYYYHTRFCICLTHSFFSCGIGEKDEDIIGHV